MDNYSDLELESYENSIDIPTTVYQDYTSTYYRTLDTIDPQAPDVPRPKKNRGRKAKKSNSEVSTLSIFFRGSKHPKKEYIRCKIIRGQKRAIRHSLNKKIPTTTIHKVNKDNKAEVKAWNDFAKHTTDNEEFFNEMSKTVNGPKTDGAAKRKKKADEPISAEVQKSFNDVFCAQYFNNCLVVENYKLYLDVIFASMDPENLINRFDFSCCKSENQKHFVDCDTKWDQLKDYLKENMLIDLVDNPANHVQVEAVDIPDLDFLVDINNSD
jgi:hypothetical protein